MKIGIVLGCFIPMHVGHIQLFEKSFKENDKTIIAVSGKDDDRGQDFIPFRDRYKLINEIYGNDDRAIIVLVDDNKLKLDGSFSYENWCIWANEMFTQAGLDPNDPDITYTWYVGEPSYERNLAHKYRHHKFQLIDRSRIPLSGTEIRNNVEKYRQFIHPKYIDYLKNKGVIS